MKHYRKLLLSLLFAISITIFISTPICAQDPTTATGTPIILADKYDQNKPEYKTVKTELRQLLHLDDQPKLTDLLPFSIGDKIGIINKSTMTVITAPTNKIKEIATIANPDLWGIYGNGTGSYIFAIYQKDGKIIITKIEEDNDPPNKEELDPVPIKDLAAGESGYILNERGIVTAQSQKYLSVQPAFNKDGKVYAAVQLKENNLFGIVDTEGEVFPGFDFKYRNLVHNKTSNYHENNIWFYAEDVDRNKYFVGIDGRKKAVPGLSASPVGEYNPFGYDIHHNTIDKTWGIFDLSTMEWSISPQSLMEFLSVSHTATKDRLYSRDVEDRKDSDIYIYVKEKKLHYYMDLNGVKYIPKEFLNTKTKKQ